MENWYCFVLAGITTGIVSSLFGVGGGILTVPILVLGFGFGQKSAQGMSLFIMLPMALAGALRYKFNPDIPINMTVCGLMALGGIAGAIIGSQLVFGISVVLLKRMFSVLLICIGINMMMESFSKPGVVELPPVQVEEVSEWVSGTAGTPFGLHVHHYISDDESPALS